MMNLRFLLPILAAAALLLSSCGNKGALVLPPKNTTPADTAQVKSS
ncbi:LPS translocon maturation chaperone LptM [Sulfuricystis thermophila]